MMTEILVQSDEEVNELLCDLKIIQAQNGYRFSIDPVLLCGFSDLAVDATVADLGTGNGIIPLILSRRVSSGRIVGIERQPAMVSRAQRSVLLNSLHERITIIEADLRNLPTLLTPESFDAVLANPPFRAEGRGRIAPDDERAAARHELAGGCADFLRAAAFLLPTGGQVFLVYLAERLTDVIDGMRNVRLEPKRLRMVHSRAGEVAKLVLVEGRKNSKPGIVVEAPLMIYRGAGRDYTEEVLAMYQTPKPGNGDA
ncbi:MAG: tRNA1(Val) (adenine(37)-N6)-methyltransferase [Desulfuromonadales bacterium]